MSAFLIRGLSFDPDGSCAVEYCDAQVDGRLAGVLVNHTMFVQAGGQYDDELDAVVLAVQALLVDVIEDLDSVTEAPVESFVDDDDE